MVSGTAEQRTTNSIDGFLKSHGLPPNWPHYAQKWFNPLAGALAAHTVGAKPTVPIYGIHGCQGSGKSTLGDYLVWQLGTAHDLRGVSLSLDDFYLTREERRRLSEAVHPLFATRGVPGTHDLDLTHTTLNQLQQGRGSCQIPRFDKTIDDRGTIGETIDLPIDFIVLEGWCLGIPHQAEADLIEPVNQLEAEEDSRGVWRNYVNRVLAEDYPNLYRRVDRWIMLRAPGFNSVFRWRLEQEHKLSRQSMQPDELARFIQHYQRLTQYALDCLPPTMHYLFQLDDNRNVVDYSQPVENRA